MEEKDLQVENGNYTRIVNRVLDELVKTPLLGAELAICLFIIRKTWGYGKKTDKISISQFQKGVKRSRPTIVKALKNLVLVNILELVKVGSQNNESSEWKFNKKYKDWNTLVNTPLLVKDRTQPSKEKLLNLVNTPLQNLVNTPLLTKEKKDNTKEIIQKRGKTPAQNAKDFFKGIDDLRNRVDSPEMGSTRRFLQELETMYPEAGKGLLWAEIQRFERYWTELNATGTKQKWQKQETFQVDRRLVTWFSRVEKFKKVENINKYNVGVVRKKK